jgi:hypothetical protein
VTAIICYSAAVAVDALAVALTIGMTRDYPVTLPDWARRTLAGEVTHHAPSYGHRPNADAIDAAPEPGRDDPLIGPLGDTTLVDARIALEMEATLTTITCTYCGRRVALDPQGRIQEHLTRAGLSAPLCAGGGTTPRAAK